MPLAFELIVRFDLNSAKLRLSRQEKQKFTIANDDLRLELQEQIEKTGDYARFLI